MTIVRRFASWCAHVLWAPILRTSVLRASVLGASVLGAAALGAMPLQAAAQTIDSYFPAGNAGFDQQLGVTVLSRARPLYQSAGIHSGAFTIRPRLDESLFFNSNPTGVGSSGSIGLHNAAGVSVDSDFRRNSLGGFLGVDDVRFFDQPGINYTDWNGGVRGGVTIGSSQLAVAYAHQDYHTIGTTIGAVASSSPVSDQIDTARADYTINLSRFAITPDISASAYRYGTATVGAIRLDQAFLDRNVVAGGVTTRYSLSEVGGLLLVVRGASATFLHPLPGQPSNDSTTADVLAGFDYQPRGLFRYRLLVGVEVQGYRAAQYSTELATVVEGSVIYTPSGRTTLTGSVSRRIQPPQSAGTNGYMLTQGRLVYDYELLRNVLLQGRGSVQYAQYLQGSGEQTNFAVGAGVNYLLNRRTRFALDADYVKQVGSSQLTRTGNLDTVTSGAFEQAVVSLTLHFAL